MSDRNREWWRGAVIYQIYPRSFQDSNGDGIGDLRGLITRLPHVASLGVDAIWISPFFKSPMLDFGYDVSDYCAVDPMFGTLEDFDAVIAEAHRLGLKVIIDQVISHTSDQHEWFKESRASRTNPKADWYVWADGKPDGSPPNNWLSVFGGSSWEWDSVRRQYYLHNFLVEQPDLNFHNPDVQDAVLDSVRFWLDRGVDGFRLDTVNFYFHDAKLRDNPPVAANDPARLGTNPYGFQRHLYDKARPENLGFLRRLRALLDSYGDKVALGEVGDDPKRSLKIVSAYTSGGDKLHKCYTFDLLGPEFSAPFMKKKITTFERGVADGWICWAYSNHDVPRHVTRWTPEGGDTAHTARFALALLVALRGSVCIYQGEELGLEEAELAFEDLQDPYGIRFWPGFKGRDGCRTPMAWDPGEPNAGFSTGKPWLPVSAAHFTQAAAVQDGDADSVLAAYRRMIAFRSAHPALRYGGIRLLPTRGDLLAFVRDDGTESVLCVFNFGAGMVDWPLPAGVDVQAALDEPQLGAELADGSVNLPARSAFFATLAAG
ncbi:MAG: alpha glucosidase [Rhizobiaceae bacterium]|nr:alpha glucosidase [Rhizobiaceae bacterium]